MVKYYEQDMSQCRAKAARYLASRPPGILSLDSIPSSLWNGMDPRECWAFGKFSRNRKDGKMQRRYGLTPVMAANERLDIFDTTPNGPRAWMAKAFGRELGHRELVVVPWLGLDLWVGGLAHPAQATAADVIIAGRRAEAESGLSASERALLTELLRFAPLKPTHNVRRMAELA